jgi:hypothetical protein
VRSAYISLLLLFSAITGLSQTIPSVDFYQQLRASTISNQVLHVENFTLRRDQLEMTFTGGFFSSGSSRARFTEPFSLELAASIPNREGF